MSNNSYSPIQIDNEITEELVSAIIDEILDYDRYGNAKIDKHNIPSFDALKESLDWELEDDKFYNDAVKYVNMLPDEFATYDGKIELSRNATLMDIDNAKVDDFVYQSLVEEACSAFEETTGQEVSLLGRNGRHVCVEFNVENLLNYSSLKETQQEFERSLIKDCNEYGKENVKNKNDLER